MTVTSREGHKIRIESVKNLADAAHEFNLLKIWLRHSLNVGYPNIDQDLGFLEQLQDVVENITVSESDDQKYQQEILDEIQFLLEMSRWYPQDDVVSGITDEQFNDLQDEVSGIGLEHAQHLVDRVTQIASQAFRQGNEQEKIAAYDLIMALEGFILHTFNTDPEKQAHADEFDDLLEQTDLLKQLVTYKPE